MRAFLAKHNISKDKWCELTGYSEDQYYRWNNPKNGASPTVYQAIQVIEAIDMNPIYVWFGIGPEKLSDVEADYASDNRAKQNFRDFWDRNFNKNVEMWERQEKLLQTIHDENLSDGLAQEQIQQLADKIDEVIRLLKS